jgi:hypothetical protein
MGSRIVTKVYNSRFIWDASTPVQATEPVIEIPPKPGAQPDPPPDHSYPTTKPEWEERLADWKGTGTPAKATEPEPYQAKTELGKKMMALRAQAIAKGMTTLTTDEILNRDRVEPDPKYVQVRREDLQKAGDASGWDLDEATYNRLKAALESE